MREKLFHVNSGEIILTPQQHRIFRKRIEKDIGFLYSSKEWVEQTEKFMKEMEEMEEKHIKNIKKIIAISLIMSILSTITFIILLAIYIQ